MANRDDRFDSGSSSSGRRQRVEPSSLESDDADIPLRHHSHTGNYSQGIMPHLPIDDMYRELGLGGVIPHNIDSTTQPSDRIGNIEQRFDSLCLEHRIQQPSDSVAQSSDVPGLCGSVPVQQPDKIGKHCSPSWFKTLLMPKNNDSKVITKTQLCTQIAE